MQTYSLQRIVFYIAILSIIIAITTLTGIPICAASQTDVTYSDSSSENMSNLKNRLENERSRHPNVFGELRNDIIYLAHESDFYGVVGFVGLAPKALRPMFAREEPELTEMWATGFADGFFESGEVIGNAVYPLAISVLCLSVGRLDHSGRVESFGSSLLRAHAINGFLTVSIKGAVNRTRPDGAPYSYPSGHTSSAFTTAAVINEHFGSKWGIPAFIAATYVGLSRLQENKHYLSDIIAGAVLGSYVGFKISGRRARFPLVSVTPLSTNGKLGLSLSFPF